MSETVEAIPPVIEPVTLPEVMAWARIDSTDDAALVISPLIARARRRAETWCRRSFVTTTWDYFLDGFPQGAPHDEFWLPRAPVQSVVGVYYYDTNNVEYVHDPSEYQVDAASEPGRIGRQFSRIWPAVVLQPMNGVRVRFVAGYTTNTIRGLPDVSQVPELIKMGIAVIVADLYNHRGDEASIGDISPRAKDALWEYRAWNAESF